MRKAAFELYWFKVEVIIEKTETYSKTYSETRNGDVFNTQWNIFDGAFCKNICLHLTVDYFCKILHIIFLWLCPDKIKQNPGVLSFISQKIRTTSISTSWFLRSCFFKCTKTRRHHHSSKNIKLAITQSKMKVSVIGFRSKCCLSFWRNLIHQISKNRSHFCANNPNPFLHIMYS